ncbi:aldehyde dehydrogenase family protein [Falsiroseomonas sp. HW251]|uniref:aldehyde dehydrogenase family protein n=1 Tax=Falsiroseomonas sp. HW251 TaxID=3390998 RepID=UPI003D3207DE
MNVTWKGQSCGSTSRAFLHESIHDAVLACVKERCEALKPGLPTGMATDVGAIVSKAQHDRILRYTDAARRKTRAWSAAARAPGIPADEAAMLRQVDAVEYGLTCSIWTRDLAAAHRITAAVDAGYIWVNSTSRHFLGAPFGGYKQSGIGREEGIEELIAYTQEKNIHITLEP